jgi:hypothetical protein
MMFDRNETTDSEAIVNALLRQAQAIERMAEAMETLAAIVVESKKKHDAEGR